MRSPTSTAAVPPERPFITINEAADLLGVSSSTVRRCIEDGRLAAFRLGRVIRVPREALDDMAAANPAREVAAIPERRTRRARRPVESPRQALARIRAEAEG